MSAQRIEDILYILTALLIILSNSIEIVLILGIWNRTIFDRLLLSLAFSDALVSVVVGFFQVSEMHLGDKFWLREENAINTFLFSITFSCTNLISITVDRFLAVQYPIKHRMLLTPKRANNIIAVLWILCFLGFSITALFTHILALEMKLILYATSISLLVFGILITILYCVIFCLVCKRKMPTAGADGGDNNVTRSCIALFLKGPYKAERSVLFTGLIVAISFIVCTYPFAFNVLITKSNGSFPFITKFLVVLNSLLNPFIYFF